MSKTKKLLITVLCFAMIITMSQTVFGAKAGEGESGSTESTAGTTIGTVNINPKTTGDGVNSATNIGNSIIGILQVVGIIVSVICLMILGIKYMLGSAEEKAEYKKTFIPYLIGALLLFAASAFAKTVFEWVTAITTTA